MAIKEQHRNGEKLVVHLLIIFVNVVEFVIYSIFNIPSSYAIRRGIGNDI